jgi:shikimate kinase/3-dehydroquinate synthase
VAEAVAGWTPPLRLPVVLAERSYEILIGPGLLARSGGLLAPLLPSKRVVVVTDRADFEVLRAMLRLSEADAARRGPR